MKKKAEQCGIFRYLDNRTQAIYLKGERKKDTLTRFLKILEKK